MSNQSNQNSDSIAHRIRQMRARLRAEAYDLMPADLAAQLPPLYATERLTGINEAIVYAKYFTPDSSWTWYCLEYSPDDHLCFGLVIGLDTEIGYFSLDELRTAHGLLGLRVERELCWTPTPLADVRSGKAR